MRMSKTNLISKLVLFTFAFYFVFNHIERSISNIFLLLTLFLSLINYKILYEALKTNYKLVFSVIAFTLYISFAGYYHDSPVSELDNYYRFFLLLPLLSISLNTKYMSYLLLFSALAGITTAIYVNAFLDSTFRFQGTSNTAITYGHMCGTLFMICIYYLLYKGNKSLLFILSAVIFLTLLWVTETRGPIIGIIIGFVYLSFVLKSHTRSKLSFKAPLIVLTFLLVSVVIIPNPLGERLKEMTNININEPLKTNSYYLKQRLFYNIYGFTEIKDNYFKGVGPQNVEKRMIQTLKDKNIVNIRPTDHLHNDYLDIILKFGVVSIVLLFLVYFYIVTVKNPEDRVILTIVMIMLLSSQLTQSQFAHHQAITFFISIFYIFMPKTRSLK